jgi:hypothetical protein
MLGAALLMCAASVASAQHRTTTRSSSSVPDHRTELIPLGGYAWTSAFDVYTGISYGELDIKDAGFYGGALDVNVEKNPGRVSQLRLLYRRSDTKVQFRSASMLNPIEVDAAVEYWHIGGVGGVPRGNVVPFAAVTLGGTRLVSDDGDDWKFSTMLGLGVKVYTSEKIGLMIQGNWAFTWIDSWGAMTIGTGGAGVSVGGTGISQFDAGGGLIINF